jgi:hypothetical protein
MNTFRADAATVQGEGAYVVLRKASWGQTQKLQQAKPEESVGLIPEVLAECVAEWNWVDEAGAPLPLPKQAGIAALSVDEVSFLVTALVATNPEAAKN